MKQYITKLIKESLAIVAPEEADEVVSTTVFDVSNPKAEFGDYATSAAMVIFKKFNRAPASDPKELAALLARTVATLDHQKVFSKIEPVGGFINFTLSEEFLSQQLKEIIAKESDFGVSDVGQGRTMIVEYFANNVAKPPHVGHLRTGVVGDALYRILKACGFNAISDTHIGDWGTQFGILLHAFKTIGSKEKVEADPINELNALYVEMRRRIENDPNLYEQSKAEFKKLEEGDSENRQLWKWFVDESKKDFERYRQLLGLCQFDYNLGESFYEDKMPAVLQELTDKGLVTTGETGELYVDLDSQSLGRCILVKSDGATTYLLRDFATYIYRKKELEYYRNLYVVDNRQSHHFKQLFRVLEMAGYPAETESRHIDVGFMSLPEGPISTRAGNAISLQALIVESQKRAMDIIEQKNPDLVNKQEVAVQVALAAIKYFDLSHNRQTEFVFTWDKALSFEGNTGPYLQYSHARIHGILRKDEAGANELFTINNNITLNPQEVAVLRKLHKFPGVIEQVSQEYLPNLLCNYLFELSQEFNSFYQSVPVLQERDSGSRNFRLSLIKATAQVLKNGLNLLGIEAPEQM